MVLNFTVLACILRPIFRVEFFLFRIIFQGISFHYSKKPSPRGWFCHLPLAVRAASSPGAAISPPAPDSPVVGDGGSPSPRGLRQSPVFGGSPQKSQPPQKIVCVGGGFLEILNHIPNWIFRLGLSECGFVRNAKSRCAILTFRAETACFRVFPQKT